MKLVLLTSDSLRHKYIASQLAANYDVELIITEKKSIKIEDTSLYNSNDANFVDSHFEKRQISEKNYFGDYKEFPSNIPHLKVPHKEINSDFIFEVINLNSPDLMILFGTSIIKNHILNKYEGKVINLHLGLSPYYKGSGTNLFPLYYKQLECIGATIHIATEKVDAGDIIHQFRPDININDNLHDIGNKVILKAGIELPKAINSFTKQDFVPVKQRVGESIICKIKDLTPNLLREIYSNFENDLVKEFLETEKQLINTKPIIRI